MSYYTELPNDLINKIQLNKCILFIGAGISRKCVTKGRKALPNWREFLLQFVDWHNEKYNFEIEYYSELMHLIEQGKYLIVAQEILEKVNESEFKEFLEKTFDSQNITPSFLHKLLAILPFRGIITTNYDNLIELTYIEQHKRVPKILTNSDILNEINPLDFPYFILKIHGDIEDPKSIILSQQSYIKLQYDSFEYRKLLEEIFSEYTVIFIGYGGNDPNVESIVDKVSLTSKNYHYMLSKENTITKIEKNRYLKDKLINVIEYYDAFNLHNHIDTFFSDIYDVLSENKIHMKPKPAQIRTRIKVFYDEIDKEDGQFIWSYFLKEGAITLGEGAQKNQLRIFLNNSDSAFTFTDFLVIFIGDTEISESNPFIQRLISIKENRKGHQFDLLLISLSKNKKQVRELLDKDIVYYVPSEFIDKDLEPIKNYISEIIRK